MSDVTDLKAEVLLLRRENAKLLELENIRILQVKFCEDLDAENAKLRTQLTDVTESVGRMEELCAKLRELVRDIYIDMWNYGEWLEPYEQRMRELGIEVDE